MIPKGVELTKLKRYPTLRRFLEGKFLRIWSGQWQAWWCPKSQGYTNQSGEAGVYTLEEALAASGHAGPEKMVVYVPASPEYEI